MRRPKYAGVYPKVERTVEEGGENPQRAGANVVSRDLLNEMQLRYPACRCEEQGFVYVGQPLRLPGRRSGSLINTDGRGGSCSNNGQCSMLDALRRRMGH
jgi:hypothetical protein